MLVRREGWSRGREGEKREFVGEQGVYWERANGDPGVRGFGISPREREERSQSSSSRCVANSWVKENSSFVFIGAVVGGGVEVNSLVTDCVGDGVGGLSLLLSSRS